jgi:Ca2+-binding RTX toxin-like protein
MARNCARPSLGGAKQSGGPANDWLVGDLGRDRLHGRGGDDRLDGGAGRDWLHGGRGDDRLSGDAGRDRLLGGKGNDLLDGGTGNDKVHGGRGEDRLSGDAGRDRLLGGRGNDLLDGGAGNDKVHGGRGDDVFVYRAGDGNDLFQGGAGSADTIRLDSVAAGWTLQLQRGAVVGHAGDGMQLSAGAAGVITFADGSKLRFKGVERIETVHSEPPQSQQAPSAPAPSAPVPVNHAPDIGELSANAVVENAANGTVVGTVSATDPDAGDALTYALLDDAGGRFTIDPTSGALMVADGSLLDYETADQHSVVVQVTDAGGLTASATFAIAVQFDNSGDDALTGGAAADVIDGGPGNDRIFGEDGNDQLSGGGGDDELDGGAGDDVLDGGDGADFLTGAGGADQLSGGAGGDMLFGDDGDDWLIGADGGDQLHGGLGNDRMDGGDGDDRLLGNSGADLLNGGAGNDSIFGSLGNDLIRGGAGSDTLSGGMDSDRFVFDSIGEGVDVITDFGGGDVLAIGNALTGFSAGQEAAFVRLVDDGTNTTVQVDADGAANGGSFTSIAVLQGVTGTTLTGQIDFWLS